ncbi:MAG: GNAT family N-acetyltransferase [Anaerolineaceae bacterium]|jgi:CelD/BcsL family acetyltransferase involved in cellulose biosynthesis
MEFTLHSDFPYALTEEWNQLLAVSTTQVPFLRCEYLAEWWTTRGGGEWPDDALLAIITAHEGSRLVGIAPLFIVEHEGENRLLLLGSFEISDYLDVICRAEDLERFIVDLLRYIQQTFVAPGTITSIDLYNIVENSPTLQALEKAAEALGADYKDHKLQHSPYIPLPADWESYLQTLDKKQRHEIRRKMRRAGEGQEELEVYITRDAGKLEDDIEDFLELMAQDEAKADFLSPMMRQQMKATMRCAFEQDCLQLAFLLIGGQKTAAYFSFDFLDRIWVYNSGLDRRYSAYSPGWVLLAHLLQMAIEQGKHEFDFMRGDETYKYKYGAVDRFIKRAIIRF